MMSLAPVDVVILLAYFGGVLFIGFRAGRKSLRGDAVDFLLAGRTLTTPLFVMTLVSTWYGGILGVGEFSYVYGISNWVIQGVPYYIFAMVFAFLLAGKIRETNLATIPDKLHLSYDRKTAVLGSVLTFLLMTPAPYVLMLAVLLQLVSGWPMLLCLVVGTAATTVYLWFGGFRSDVHTDVFEFVLMFLGFAVIIPFAVSAYGGLEFLVSHLPPLHLTWNGGNSLQFIIVWFFIALWTLVDPSFHQRCYAARSGEVARNGILLSIIFWFVFDAMTATAGLYARAALPGLAQPVMAYPLLAEAILPAGAKGFFYVGMLATIMSTLNTLALVSATTLGRDIVWRIRGTPAGGDEQRLIRWGLVVSALFSIALAIAIPSVIRLWYTIGTVIVPGLLVPLVTSYFERMRVRSAYAFCAMLLGWLTSLGWLLAGWSGGIGRTDFYPLGVEPMYPGLVVSIAVWGSGILAKGRTPDAVVEQDHSNSPRAPVHHRTSR
jgi:SSS family solute:Na+ symporter